MAQLSRRKLNNDTPTKAIRNLGNVLIMMPIALIKN